MIIVDYSTIAFSNIYALKQSKDFDATLIRHMILNTLRMYNVKFRHKYGDMVIACDGKGSWRRGLYPEYKANRRASREVDDGFDWDGFFEILNTVQAEIDRYLPWKVVKADCAEADDIIATLVNQTQEFGKYEEVMIVSSDKDFIQLHRFNNVKQFSPKTKKLIKEKNPAAYLKEHLYRGDSGDGVPNILSADNALVDGIRQNPITKKKIEEWNTAKNDEEFAEKFGTDLWVNYQRNRNMIDLDYIPSDLAEVILKKYDEAPVRSDIFNYFIAKRCRNLIECIEEFKPIK